MTRIDRLRHGRRSQPPSVEPIETSPTPAAPEVGRTLNLLGLRIGVDRNPSRAVKWSRRTAVMGAISLVVLSSGVAFAYWSTTGSGTGAAQATGFVTPAVTAGTTSAQLYPGLTANGTTAGADLVFSVSNTNPFAVTITSISLTGATVSSVTGATKVGSEDQPTANTNCATTPGLSYFSGTPTVTYSTGSSIPANGSATVTLSKVVGMTASAPECQSATFYIKLANNAIGYQSP